MRRMIHCMTVLVFTILETSAQMVDYCDIVCPNTNEMHSMCARKKCRLGAPCNRADLFINNDVNTTDIEHILDGHNSARSQVALGLYGTQPPASNMYKLLWSKELAHIAQCWANKCVYENDKCRDTLKFEVGQLINRVHPVMTGLYMYDIISSWMNTNQEDEYSEIYWGTKNSTYPFTQLVWARTRYLGCGFVTYLTAAEHRDTMHLFCNYGPRGNVIGASMYRPGQPCTACEDGTHCSHTYPGLCTFEIDMKEAASGTRIQLFLLGSAVLLLHIM